MDGNLHKDRKTPAAGTPVHVLGLARSGAGAALLAARLGCRVSATDMKTRQQIPDADALERAGVMLDLGGHDPRLFDQARLVVVSPGVPDIPVLARAEASGAEIISEVELAYRASRAAFVGITGSNGKSTVTTMTGGILSRSSRPCWTGGNLGTAPSLAVGGEADVDGGVFVLELSSFQLERVRHMRCEVATILNVTPDHMDRYRDMDQYAKAKGNVFMNQEPTDHAVVLAGETWALRLAQKSNGRLHVLGEAGSEIFFEDRMVRVQGPGMGSASFVAADIGLPDRLAVQNGMVAMAIALLAGASIEEVGEGLRAFRPLAHRFELVAEANGVKWVNDSKATNPASVVAALEAATAPVILIAGGLDKKLDYEDIVPAAKDKVIRVLLIGQAAEAIGKAFDPVVQSEHVGTIEAAVERAAALARPGTTVLLSPACASFDQFRNFEHRGDVFRELARGIARSSGSRP